MTVAGGIARCYDKAGERTIGEHKQAMGSMVHLALGEFEVDWGKNNAFTNHGSLFQPGDVVQVPYRYVGDDDEPITEMHEGVARPLRSVVRRLELLGHTVATARRDFEEVMEQHADEPLITFDQLMEVLVSLDIDTAATEYHKDYDFGEFFAREIFDRLNLSQHVADVVGARFVLGEVMENFFAYDVLRLLAENPVNLDRTVRWHYHDVVEGGWVSREEIIDSLGARRQYLIVTEGSSDAHIIKHALSLLRPDIADFFYFVDMEDGYPFTGTGNLHRFCQGLVGIHIENRVLIIYDNDTEGNSRYADTKRLRLPPNMRVMRLSSLPSLASIETVGPNGQTATDINERAASIECYLDLNFGTMEKPLVRWTSFSSTSGTYQGELVNKQAYAKRFLNLRTPPSEYDFSKLNSVLDDIVQTCIAISTGETPQS